MRLTKIIPTHTKSVGQDRQAEAYYCCAHIWFFFIFFKVNPMEVNLDCNVDCRSSLVCVGAGLLCCKRDNHVFFFEKGDVPDAGPDSGAHAHGLSLV